MPLLQMFCLLPTKEVASEYVEKHQYDKQFHDDIQNHMISQLLQNRKRLRYVGFSAGKGCDASWIFKTSWCESQDKHVVKRCLSIKDELPYLPRYNIFSGLFHDHSLTIEKEAELPMFMW